MNMPIAAFIAGTLPLVWGCEGSKFSSAPPEQHSADTPGVNHEDANRKLDQLDIGAQGQKIGDGSFDDRGAIVVGGEGSIDTEEDIGTEGGIGSEGEDSATEENGDIGGEESHRLCSTDGDFIDMDFPSQFEACNRMGRMWDAFRGKCSFVALRDAEDCNWDWVESLNLIAPARVKGLKRRQTRLVACGQTDRGLTSIWSYIVLPDPDAESIECEYTRTEPQMWHGCVSDDPDVRSIRDSVAFLKACLGG